MQQVKTVQEAQDVIASVQPGWSKVSSAKSETLCEQPRSPGKCRETCKRVLVNDIKIAYHA